MEWVFLNTHRKPVAAGNPGAGRVLPFITSAPRVAAGFSREDVRVLRSLGLPVPGPFARLFGYRVESLR